MDLTALRATDNHSDKPSVHLGLVSFTAGLSCFLDKRLLSNTAGCFCFFKTFSFLKDFLTNFFSDLVDWPSPFDMLGARMSGVCSVIQNPQPGDISTVAGLQERIR